MKCIDRTTPHSPQYSLVHFEIPVDVFDKGERGEEGYCPNHKEENVTEEEGVPKEFHCLQCAIHV